MSRIIIALAVASACSSIACAAPTGRVNGVGVSLALPAGWHSWVPPTAVKPTITDPLTRLVAVSAAFGFGAGGCQVDYRFPATGVAVVILEWVPTKGMHMPAPLPTRPASFSSKTLTLRAHSAECFNGPAGAIEFTDRGRAFMASIEAGSNASSATIARARAVLDSLRVQRL